MKPMKRGIVPLALILLLTCLPLGACAPEAPPDETLPFSLEESATSPAKETESDPETPSYPKFEGKITPSQLDAIPIANENMSSDELRQICLDYFRMQLTFQWTPAKEIAYTITSYDKKVNLQVGKVYAGLPYISESRSGNLYHLFRYYDPETGVLDPGGIQGRNFVMLLGQHCASGATWGWNRVVNSTRQTLTAQMIHSRGFLRVGPYTYPDEMDAWEREGNTTKKICLDNGEQTMYQSYASLLPADGMVLVITGGMHVRMAVSVHVEYRADGVTIDGDKSYVTYLDQGSSFATLPRPEGGVVYVQGGVDEKESFKKLYSAGYVPFTFKEFHGQDPIEAGSAFLDPAPAETVTLSQITATTLKTNYPIAETCFALYDARGKVVYETARAPSGNLYKTYETLLSTVISSAAASRYLGDGVTAEISCRLGNGEIIEVFSGTIVK